VGVVTEPVVAAQTYARWRSTMLGGITERVETSAVFDLVGPLQGLRVLDVGTGDGTYAIEAAARSRAASRGIDITLIQGRAERLPFDDASFDVVLAVTVLCYVPDAGLAVREMARVLASGGRLILGELRALQRVGGRAPRAGMARCGPLATSAVLVTLRARVARARRWPPRR